MKGCASKLYCHNDHTFWLIDYLPFYVPLKNFSLVFGDVTIAGEGLQNLGPCSVLGPLSREGSLSCHTCCDTGPQFFRSHPKVHPIQSPLATRMGMRGGPILTRILTGDHTFCKNELRHCLFIAAWAILNYPAAVTITGDRAANSDQCVVLMAFSSESSFTCHTCCDLGLYSLIWRTGTRVSQCDSILRRKDHQVFTRPL
jgi:hypothetical protein